MEESYFKTVGQILIFIHICTTEDVWPPYLEISSEIWRNKYLEESVVAADKDQDRR